MYLRYVGICRNGYRQLWFLMMCLQDQDDPIRLGGSSVKEQCCRARSSCSQVLLHGADVDAKRGIDCAP